MARAAPLWHRASAPHALDAGRYEHVCRLVSAGYDEHNKVRNRRECTLGLRLHGYVGKLELVRERGRYRVLAVRGA